MAPGITRSDAYRFAALFLVLFLALYLVLPALDPSSQAASMAASLDAALDYTAVDELPPPDELRVAQRPSSSSSVELQEFRFQQTQVRWMTAIEGGRPTVPWFVLIHGGSVVHQNAQFWEPRFSVFTDLGFMSAVDLLGHGNSTRGPFGSGAQAFALLDMMRVRAGVMLGDAEAVAERAKSDGVALHAEPVDVALGRMAVPVVLVARSAGAQVLFEAVKEHYKHSQSTPPLWRLHGIVLIAPAIQNVPNLSVRCPTLVVWNEQDVVVPFKTGYAKLKSVLPRPTDIELVTFDSEAYPPVLTHVPEALFPDEFQAAVSKFVAGIDLSQGGQCEVLAGKNAVEVKN